MAFDSVFNGDPTTPNVSASGDAAFGIDLNSGKLYFRSPLGTLAGWQLCAGSTGSVTSDQVTNESAVSGATVTAALNTLNAGSGVLKTLTVTLTAAQLNAIIATPIIILSGVPGKYLGPVNGMAEYHFVTTPYTLSGGGTLLIGAAGGVGGAYMSIPFAGMLDQTADTMYDASGQAFASGPAPSAAVSGAALQVLANGEVTCTGGDGTLTITVNYIEYTL